MCHEVITLTPSLQLAASTCRPQIWPVPLKADELADSPVPQPLAQALAGRYTIERELGRGGMAVVYLAIDVKHARRVALKVIRADMTWPGAAERFSREIRVAAGLQHPHALTVFDSGEAAGQLWFTMPYVEGESLRQRLDRETRLPVAEAIRISREAALALAQAHALGIVHRDVKPENILLGRDGSALVADFGVARAVATATGHGTPSETITTTGLAIGTPAYMAPEQLMGETVDARSDIWSLGVVVREMITGRRAGKAGGAGEAGVPVAVETVLVRALQTDPAARYGSMQEFSGALTAAERETWRGPVTSPAPRRGLIAGIAAIALLLALAVVFGRGRSDNSGAADATALSRLAVLPFENQGDSADAYFAEGMADELTTALANVSGLRVAARSSVARFRDQRQDLAAIGRALGVGAVLDGTVRRSGDRIRVSTQLTGTGDGLVLWAERYDRAAGDVFAVQDEIARAIAGALRTRLGAGVGDAVTDAHRGTADLVTYDLYLKGRFAWSKRGRQGLRDAIQYFDRAVTREPGFARAHAGLAMAYGVLPVFDDTYPTDSSMAQAERSAQRALELDSTLSDAHLALGYVLKNRWRFAEAEPYFRNALALAPDDPVAHHWYGVYLYATGRAEESVAQLAAARRLDPFSPAAATDHSTALWAAGRLDEALVAVRHALALDPGKSDAHFMASLVQLARGRPDSAVIELAESRRLGIGFDIRGYLSVAYRQLGRRAEADSLRTELDRAVRDGRATAFDLAVATAGAGEREAALAAIERTVRERVPIVTEFSLPCEPAFRALREERRFQAALARVGMSVCEGSIALRPRL